MTWISLVHTAPEYCGLYSIYSEGRLLYIGKSKNIRRRLNSHGLRKEFILHKADEVRTLHLSDFAMLFALEIEGFMISRWKPPLNTHKIGPIDPPDSVSMQLRIDVTQGKWANLWSQRVN